MPEATAPASTGTVTPAEAAQVVAAAAAEATQAPPTTPPAQTEPPKQEAVPAERNDFAQPMALLAKQTKEIARQKQQLAQEKSEREAAIKRREDDLASRIAKAEELENLRKNA